MKDSQKLKSIEVLLKHIAVFRLKEPTFSINNPFVAEK